MARPTADSVTFRVTVSKRTGELLEALAALGIHGQNVPEVARTFIQKEVERLVVTERILATDLGINRARSKPARVRSGTN